MSPERVVSQEVKSLRTPNHFKTRHQAVRTCQAIREGRPILSQAETTRLAKLAHALSDAKILIEEGNATLVIIKPQANQGNYPNSNKLSDERATNILLSEIGKEHILLAISLTLAKTQAEKFYESNRQQQEQVVMDNGQSLWRQVIDFAVSGPITFLIATDESGRAIENMRQKIGATWPSRANPESLRGRYGLDRYLPNNLFHTSDSVESARAELTVIQCALLDLANKASDNRKI